MRGYVVLAAAVVLWCGIVGARGGEPKSLWTRTKGIDWPQFLGPHRDSRSAETGLAARRDGPPRRVWQVELGEGYSIGSVAAGRFFQADRMEDEIRLRCLVAETGRLLWEFRYQTDYEDMYGYDGGPRASPIVDGDRVYLFGPEGMLYCLAVEDGKEIWRSDTARQFHVVQNFFGVGSTPVVFQEKLIVMVGGSPPEDQRLPPGALDRVRGDGSAIVAFDKRTGKILYRLSDELASYASPRIDTIGGRPWCFAYCRGGLLAFDPRTGKKDFHFPWRARLLESAIAASPVVVNDEVLISETYGPGSCLLKVRPGGYDIVWQDDPRRRAKRLQAHWVTPVYCDGYVYGSSGRNPPVSLRCLEWKSGKVMWDVPGQYRTSFLYVDGHLITLDERGRLTLVRPNPQRYERIATWDLSRDAAAPLRYPCWAAPVLSHGLLYVRGKDRLVCYELIPE